MAVGTATGRTVTTTVTAANGNQQVAVAAGSVTRLIESIGVQKGTAPELQILAVKYPTAVGASGATTDAFLTIRSNGLAGATYALVLSVQEVDTA